jgi:hypothetical protein
MIRVYFKSPAKAKRDKFPSYEIARHPDGKRWRIYANGRTYRMRCGLSIFPSERSALAMLKTEFTVPGLFEIEERP